MFNNRKAFLVQALTDLHAGSGKDYTRGVDRVVQRDYAGMPVVNGSSVKGALRAHCAGGGIDSDVVNQIFGAFVSADEEKDQKSKVEQIPSRVSTGDMRMLAVTCNYNSKFPFVLVTCPLALSYLIPYMSDEELQLKWPTNEESKFFLLADARIKVCSSAAGIYRQNGIEEYYGLVLKLQALMKGLCGISNQVPIALVSNYAFREEILSVSLPIVSRNSLQRGKSINLWTEEYVPAGTVFLAEVDYRTVQANHTDDPVSSLWNELSHTSGTWKPPIRMGSGKSVGKGQTYWSELPVSLSTRPAEPEEKEVSDVTAVNTVVEVDGQVSNTDSSQSNAVQRAKAVDASCSKWTVDAQFIGPRQRQLETFRVVVHRAIELGWVGQKQHLGVNWLILPDASHTAMNRVTSLLRMSTYALLSTLKEDESATGDARQVARCQVAKLLAGLLEKRFLPPIGGQAAFFASAVDKSFNSNLPNDFRRELIAALDEIRKVAACCYGLKEFTASDKRAKFEKTLVV